MAEFLTPLYGGGTRCDGTPDSTLERGGVKAQKLRYLDVLLESPWAVHIGPRVGVPVDAELNVDVPNAVSFMVQKLLIHSDRRPAKKAPDVLYVHDTLELFGGSLDELRRLWLQVMRPRMGASSVRTAKRRARDLFAE